MKEREAEKQYRHPFTRYVILSVSALLFGCSAFVLAYFNTDWFYELDADRTALIKEYQSRSVSSAVVSWENYVAEVDEAVEENSAWDEDNDGGDEGGSTPGGTPSGNEIPAQYPVTDEEIQKDIEAGLYTSEDYAYLVSIGGESPTYEGFYAVASSVRNRVNSAAWPSSYKGVVTQSGQYSAYNSSEINNPRNSDVRDAAVAVLRGGESSVGGCCSFFGRWPDGTYDMWADPSTCAEFYNVGGNIFHNGGVSNKKGHDCPEGGILIWNHNTGEWVYPSGTHYP